MDHLLFATPDDLSMAADRITTGWMRLRLALACFAVFAAGGSSAFAQAGRSLAIQACAHLSCGGG